MESLQGALGVMKYPVGHRVQRYPRPQPRQTENKEILYQLKLERGRSCSRRTWTRSVEVEMPADGVKIRIDAPRAVRGRRSRDQPRRATASCDIAGRLPGRKGRRTIQVEGHTDAMPISTARFPSNWELSAARAGSVARYFQGEGLTPERIAATGYGEFHPLAANDTAEGRAKNRRVEIFLRVQRKQPSEGSRPVSEVLDGRGGTAPRPTPVTDRLRSLQRDP